MVFSLLLPGCPQLLRGHIRLVNRGGCRRFYVLLSTWFPCPARCTHTALSMMGGGDGGGWSSGSVELGEGVLWPSLCAGIAAEAGQWWVSLLEVFRAVGGLLWQLQLWPGG